MTLLIPSSDHGGPGSEPAALLSWVRRRFVRWLTGAGMKETRWSYAVKGELLVPVEARGSEEQKLALHDTGGAELDLHYHFPGAGLRIGAAVASDEDDAFPPGKTGRKLWAPADAEGDEKGGKLQSRAGLKRALLIDLHQLFGRRSLGGPASGAVMLLGIDSHCAAWVRKIGFHSQRLRQLVEDGRGAESGFSFEDLRDDVNTSFQETGFQAALFFDGVAGGRAGKVAYFGEITNATAEDHTSDAPDVAAAVQALSSLGKLAKTVVPQLISPPKMSASALSSLLTDVDKAPDTEATPATSLTPPTFGRVLGGGLEAAQQLARQADAIPPPVVAPAPGAGGPAAGKVGELPPDPALHPQTVFMQTDAYKDLVKAGWPELNTIGVEGGGITTFAAVELEGGADGATLDRIGYHKGKWWRDRAHGECNSLHEFRHHLAVIPGWKADHETWEQNTIHLPRGFPKGPKAWVGEGAPAYSVDKTTGRITEVYMGKGSQTYINPSDKEFDTAVKTKGPTKWAPPPPPPIP